ncbi:MAG: S8 family serine peptidase [Anaerolineales bacterium]|nr:S8 family serine peptidase [Anaerolineales bacterium]
MIATLFGAAPAQADGKLRVFVEFAPGQKAAVEKALNAAGAEFHYSFDELNAFAVSVPEAALKGLSRNPNVVLIEEDPLRAPVEIMPSSVQAVDAGQTVPYGIDMVQARDVWDVNRDNIVDTGAPTGAGIKVCIIDSGFYTGHEDFQGISVTGSAGNLPWATDGFGHGSHVAGTIAAVNNALGVVGVTPGTVSLHIVRVFGDDGAWAYSSTLINAANLCRDAGAKIISMSLGGAKSNRTEQNGFNTLYNTYGILSIAAAGNEGTSANNYPASYTSVVSVAAIDSNKVVADFSQYNAQVELAAPGVGVLSTVPYIDSSTVTVDGVTYTGGHIEFSARGSASGALVDGGRCGTTGAWAGKVVLCERGDYDFSVKVLNVQNSGGVAAVIYNNVPGGFLGTMGESSSTIVGISLSQEDGQYLVANKLGSVAAIESTLTKPASGYEAWDGTSMATPHASAVAALVWSSKPTATNAEIRAVLQQTAQDLGTAGRDVYYGFGLVQAKAAVDALGGGGGGEDKNMSVKDLDATKSAKGRTWTPKFTITIKDVDGVLVTGAKVNGTINTTSVSCTTGTTGTCTVSASLSTSETSATYTVSGVTATGYIYDPTANSDPDGDSNGTTITIYK